MKIIAIGDLDSDGYADIITLNDAEDTFMAHLYDPKKQSYDRKIDPVDKIADKDVTDAKIVNIAVSKNMQHL